MIDERAVGGPISAPGGRRQADGDRCYRRGYHHAFEAALRMVRAGATVEELIRHADRVEAWREGRPGGTYCPPAFDPEGA